MSATEATTVRRRRDGGGENARSVIDTNPYPITPSKHTPRPLRAIRRSVAADGQLRPFRLLKEDAKNLRRRFISDWTCFNQLVFASAVYVFFTNLLPGITFASDLYVLTGQNWGTIEVVFSTGLCGLIFSMSVVLGSLTYICFPMDYVERDYF